MLQGTSIDTIKHDYLTILKSIKENSPNTKTFLQSILPISDNKVHEHILELNTWLSSVAKEQKFTFINLYHKFLMNNTINPGYNYDGIHLRYAGYLAWKDEIYKDVN